MNTGRRERGEAVSLLLCFLLSLGVLLGPAGMAQAQDRTTGTIGGELTDASGGVLPGVSVVFTNQTTQRVTTVVSDGAGVYRADLEPGRYALRFELSGFARQEVPDVQVQLGRTFTINATMKVGNVSEAVQVTAESSPLVDMRSTTITHNVSAEQIDRMPKGRSFQSIAMTAPSVNRGDIEGGFQVNGASGAENAFTVDGVVTNSLINGASRQDTVFEYLQEVQVKTTGVPAEVGGALGGVISAVTKSGGNIFKGEAHYYLLGSSLSAGPVKRLVLSPVDDKTVTFVQDNKDPDHNNEFGGSLGGPIMRDKLWFFGSVSPRFNRTNEPLPVQSGNRSGRHRAQAGHDAGIREGQLWQPTPERLRHHPEHVEPHERHPFGLQRHRGRTSSRARRQQMSRRRLVATRPTRSAARAAPTSSCQTRPI